MPRYKIFIWFIKGVENTEFIDEIYIGESIHDLGTIFYALNHRIPCFNIYCLCTSIVSPFVLEILSSQELIKKRNQERNFTIIGIASGKKEAYDLLRHIVLEQGLIFLAKQKERCNH